MSKLYVLLVGIDRYADPGIRELHGCKNDVEDAVTMLRSRADSGGR